MVIVKFVALAVITALVGIGGEYILRRDRKRSAARRELELEGVSATGTVHALAKVSTGKYGQYRWRAEITYVADGNERTLVESWAPDELPGLTEGMTFPVRYAMNDPQHAMVVGATAPAVPSAWTWRGLTLFVVIVGALAIIVF